MSPLLWILGFALIGGVFSVLAASLFLIVPDHRHPHLIPHGVSFALGALLSVAFLELLPHAIQQVGVEGTEDLFFTVLLGLLGFFLLEKFLVWRHCHTGDCAAHTEGHSHQSAGTLIVLGDSIHNFVDGVLIAAATLTDIQLGLITSIAVAAHEIPQEVGDFAILLQSGYRKGEAFLYNLLSSAATIVGGVLAYFGLETLQDLIPHVLAIAASSFIYIAVSDLIPTLHRKTRALETAQQVALILAGMLVIVAAHRLTERFDPPSTRSPPLAAHSADRGPAGACLRHPDRPGTA